VQEKKRRNKKIRDKINSLQSMLICHGLENKGNLWPNIFH
jgi:hypothetical protein